MADVEQPLGSFLKHRVPFQRHKVLSCDKQKGAFISLVINS